MAEIPDGVAKNVHIRKTSDATKGGDSYFLKVGIFPKSIFAISIIMPNKIKLLKISTKKISARKKI